MRTEQKVWRVEEFFFIFLIAIKDTRQMLYFETLTAGMAYARSRYVACIGHAGR